MNKKKNKETGKKCNDKLCPIHGTIRIRGRTFIGEVISTKMHKTATVQFERRHYIQKYERYEKRRTKLKVHNPECINAKEGELVKIGETRPISKTKNFAIIEKIGEIKGFKEKMELLEEAKVKVKKAEETEKHEEEK